MDPNAMQALGAGVVDRLMQYGVIPTGAGGMQPQAPSAIVPVDAQTGQPVNIGGQSPLVAALIGALAGGLTARNTQPQQEPVPGWPGNVTNDWTAAVGANAGAGSSIAAATPVTGMLSTRRMQAWTLTHAGAPAVGEQAIITIPTAQQVQWNGKELPFLAIHPQNANAGLEGLGARWQIAADGVTITGVIVSGCVASAAAASTFVLEVGDQD